MTHSQPADHLPPRNTTTAVLHYLQTPGSAPLLDATFTVRGIRTGRQLGRWITLLLQEHSCAELDSTVEVWHHYPSGEFVPTEITHCPSSPSTP